MWEPSADLFPIKPDAAAPREVCWIHTSTRRSKESHHNGWVSEKTLKSNAAYLYYYYFFFFFFRYDGKRYGEHSGKRGMATQAAANGLSEEEIRDGGNWASATTARKYIQQSTPVRVLKNKRLQAVQKGDQPVKKCPLI